MFMNKTFHILDGIEGFFYFSRKQIIVAELKEKNYFVIKLILSKQKQLIQL